MSGFEGITTAGRVGKSEPAGDDCDVDSLIHPVQNPSPVNSVVREDVAVRLVNKRRCV